MKNVLVVTYHFPPEGGTAVQRVAKFVKYLPSCGFTPTVLAARHRYRTLDQSLCADIPDGTGVYRVRDWGRAMPYELRRLLRGVYVPDTAALWGRTAVRRGISLVREHDIDVIFSTSPPHSVHLVAADIARRTGLPWVADFRDEWTSNSLAPKNGTPGRHRELERRVLEECNAVTTIGACAGRHLEHLAGDTPVAVIRNGYDPGDFTETGGRAVPAGTDRIEMVYTGRFNKLHDPGPFFRMLDALKRAGTVTPGTFRLHVVGSDGNRRWLERWPGLADMVSCTGYREHADCLKTAGNAAALLLLATSMNGTEMYPAKMYEYFRLGKPVLALVSRSGELSGMLERYGPSFIGYEDRPGSLEQAFMALLEALRSDGGCSAPDPAYVASFDRSHQARQLADVLAGVLTP